MVVSEGRGRYRGDVDEVASPPVVSVGGAKRFSRGCSSYWFKLQVIFDFDFLFENLGCDIELEGELWFAGGGVGCRRVDEPPCTCTEA